MKIIIDCPGQTCNRFWSFAALIAEGLEKRERVVVLHPDALLSDYPNLLKSDVISFPFFSVLLIRILGFKKYASFLFYVFNNRYVLKLYPRIEKLFPKVRFIKAWDYRGENKYFDSQKKLIQSIFKPVEKITYKVDNLLATHRKTYDCIVGIHIRRGDYKEWLQGRYFYSLSQYYAVMLKINALFPEKNILFMIASNERIDCSFFHGLNTSYIPNSNGTEDLYLLSKCDYIAGPLSTYSRWASFVGEVPLYVIEDPDNREITRSDFSGIIDLYHTKSGKEFINYTALGRY